MPATKVAFLNRSTFYNIVRREPEIGIRAIELLSERLSFYEKKISDLAVKKVPARLASLIVDLSDLEGVHTKGGPCFIPTHYTHEHLATMIGAARVAVTRAMKDLREAGAVGVDHRRLVIRDAEALKRIAEQAA